MNLPERDWKNLRALHGVALERYCTRVLDESRTILADEARSAHNAEGEAKFWIDPVVGLHANYGLKPKRLAEAQQLVEEHVNEIRDAWAKHFTR